MRCVREQGQLTLRRLLRASQRQVTCAWIAIPDASDVIQAVFTLVTRGRYFFT